MKVVQTKPPMLSTVWSYHICAAAEQASYIYGANLKILLNLPDNL